MKRCGACGKKKPLEKFYPKKSLYQDQYSSDCKKCKNDKSKAYYKANKKVMIIKHREYYRDVYGDIRRVKKVA